MEKTKVLVLFLLAQLFILVSCSPKKETPAAPQVVTESAKELRIFTWSEYLPDQVIQEFEAENNLKVKIDYFSSNEELLAKIQSSVESGSQGYDVIVPSDYMAQAMTRLGLLRQIPHEKVPSISSFAADFKDPAYNRGLTHVVPYAWGTTAVAVNVKKLPEYDTSKFSWKDFFEAKGALKGNVTWLDDMREVVHAALLANGKRWTSATETDVRAAFEYLKVAKKNFKIFTPESRPVMERGDCFVCMSYSGDILQIARDKKFLKYVLPVEGATIWTDNLAVPKNASQSELAFKLINKLLEAKSAKIFVEKSLFGTPNAEALALIRPEVQNNTAIFPPGPEFKKLEYLLDRPELLTLMDKLWTEFKSN